MKHTAIVFGLLLLTASVSYGQTIDFETMSGFGSVGSYLSPTTPLGDELKAEYPLIKDFGPSSLVEIANPGTFNGSTRLLRLMNSMFVINGEVTIGPFVQADQMQFSAYSTQFYGQWALFRVEIYDASNTLVAYPGTPPINPTGAIEVYGGSLIYSTLTVPAGGYVRILKLGSVADLYLDNFSSPGFSPVEMTSFSARSFDNSVKLTWQTATEMNNYGFAIERSHDGKKWDEIGFVAGHGNSFSPKNYTFTDVLDADAKLVRKFGYRLRQIDRDGTTDYSNIVTLNRGAMATGVELLNAYPNPFNPSTTINFSLDAPTEVSVKVYDMYGRNVSTLVENASFEAGIHTVAFRAGSLPSGTYLVMLNAAGVTRHQRIVLSK